MCPYKEEPIPSIEFVERQLHQICLFFNDIYIIVDGLDECAARDTIQIVLLRLAGSAKVLVTSRPETDLVSAFAGQPCLNMDEAAKVDIKKHVQWQMQNNPGLKNIRPSLKQKIEKDLVAKSAGMYCPTKISLIVRFRWVQCQLDYIQSLRQDAARREALNRLPPGLPATYNCMLERIGRSQEDLRIARAALTWLIYAYRPLKLSELAIAAVLDPDTEFNDEQRLDADEIIIEICGSLIKMQIETQIVTFGHFSVREYLSSPLLPDGSENSHYISETDGNTLLMRASFSYMLWALRQGPCDTMEELNELHADTFLTYALYNWPRHSQSLIDNVVCTKWILAFFESSCFRVWSQAWVQTEETGRWNLWNRETCTQDLGDKMEISATPLYFAALFGFHRTAQLLLEKGVDPNQPGGLYDYPLFAAIVNENVAALRVLLTGGASTRIKRISDEGCFGETPLHLASRLWNKEIVEILLQWNADLNATTANGLKPICEALSEDRSEAEALSELVMLLLPAVDVVLTDTHDSPLHIAAKYGQVEAARLILEVHGPTYINKFNRVNNTALHHAVLHGDQTMVDLLLEAGADKTIRGRYGWTPLHLAVWEHNVSMIEKLGKFSVDNALQPDLSTCNLSLPVPTQRIVGEDNNVLQTPTLDPSSRYYRALQHLLLTNQHDHIWRTLLSDYYFRRGKQDLGLALHEQALCLNPRNRNLDSVNKVAHSVPCVNCKREIRGNLYKCRRPPCYANICKDCLKSDSHVSSHNGGPHDLLYWDSQCWLPWVKKKSLGKG